MLMGYYAKIFMYVHNVTGLVISPHSEWVVEVIVGAPQQCDWKAGLLGMAIPV